MSDIPDYRKAVRLASKILRDSKNIYSFPFKLIPVIEEFTDLQIMSFSTARERGFDPKLLSTEDACINELYGVSFLFLNDTMPKSRQKFSLAHELGHVLLGHKLKNHQSDPREETEANVFAAQLLMPEQIIYEFEDRGAELSENLLIGSFDVSKAAALIRLETLEKIHDNHIIYDHNDKLIMSDLLIKYNSFINKTLPLTFSQNIVKILTMETLIEIKKLQQKI